MLRIGDTCGQHSPPDRHNKTKEMTAINMEQLSTGTRSESIKRQDPISMALGEQVSAGHAAGPAEPEEIILV